MSDATYLTARAVPARPGFGRRVISLFELRRQRRALRDMEPHMLRDIGLTHAEARAEAARPIWDVPPGWRI